VAAQALRKAGKRVVVLEARNRIGGRVWTTQIAGLTVDLGASWIHGVTGNPLTALAQQAGATTVATHYEKHNRYHPNGRPIADADDQALEALWAQFLAWREGMSEAGPDTSLRAAVDAFAAAKGLLPRDRLHLDYLLATEVEHEFAQDAALLSARHFDDTSAFGGDDVIFPQGFGAVVAALAQGLDVRLGVEVAQVDTASGQARVTDRSGQLWQAAQVVVTLPLGVIKAGAVQFLPPLPAPQQAALQRLGMGVLNKVLLTWPQARWPKAHLLGRVTSPHADPWVEWLNLQALLGAPALLGFVAGGPALALEAKSDAELQRLALAAAQSMHPSPLAAPAGFARTAWGTDPFARGSYSSIGVGGSKADCETLAQRFSPVLILAGEHTHGAHQGTVHGALMSGQRAAKQVLAG
jgi:monoamine oxidase